MPEHVVNTQAVSFDLELADLGIASWSASWRGKAAIHTAGNWIARRLDYDFSSTGTAFLNLRNAPVTVSRPFSIHVLPPPPGDLALPKPDCDGGGERCLVSLRAYERVLRRD